MDDMWGTGRYLNAEIATDTVGTEWQNGTRVYVLKKGGIYPWNTVFNIGAGRTLKMRAETGGTGKNPIIFLYDAAGSDRPPGNLVSLTGSRAVVDLKNLIISGYDEEDLTQLDGLQGGLIQVPAASSGVNMYIKFDQWTAHTHRGEADYCKSDQHDICRYGLQRQIKLWSRQGIGFAGSGC
jgi:hypothetical protein